MLFLSALVQDSWALTNQLVREAISIVDVEIRGDFALKMSVESIYQVQAFDSNQHIRSCKPFTLPLPTIGSTYYWLVSTMFLPTALSAVLLPFLVVLEARASPLVKRAAYKPALEREFADPAVLLANDGKYYAYATWGNSKQVQVAISDDGLSWTYQDVDALPTLPGWSWVEEDGGLGPETWAVDVAANDDGRYYMYFSTRTNKEVTPKGVHCLGVAVASDPIGPFYPLVEYWDEPWECDEEAGVIDPEQFTDRDGEKFVLYKVDGNSVEGRDSTPIMIQRVDADGRTKVGDAIQILDRDDADGILIEAPSLNLVDDTYYLTFSSNYWGSDLYDTSYATATSVLGPYTKAQAPDAPLLVTDGSKAIYGPGGADITPVPNLQPAIMLYHASPISWGSDDTERKKRYMYAAQVELHDGKITIYNQPEQ